MEIICLILSIITVSSTTFLMICLRKERELNEELLKRNADYESTNKKMKEALESIKIANAELNFEKSQLDRAITQLKIENEKLVKKNGNKKETKKEMTPIDVKRILRVNGVRYSVKNKGNHLLKIYGAPFELYAGTLNFVNKATKPATKGKGLDEFFKELKKYKKGEK